VTTARTTSPRTLERHAVLLVGSPFAFFGLVFGVWLTLLPDLQRVLGLSPGMLGAALTAGLVASLPSMVVAGRLADRWGARSVVAGSAALIGAALVGVASSGSYVLLCGVFVLFYAATGVFDVGINTCGMALEQATRKQIMSYFHAAFSGFAALGALAAGALLAFGVPFRALYVGAALLALGLGLFWRGALPGATPPAEQEARSGRLLYRARPLLLLAGIVALAFLSEGEMGNWAAIYLRSALGLPVMVGALGFAVFHAAMFAGRLAGARAVVAVGRKAVLALSGTALATGMLLALSTTRAPVVLLGFLLVGLALSVVAPVAYSLAGDLSPECSGEASGVLTTVGYSGYLFGPVLVGGLAELTGLRLALLTVAVAGAGITLLGMLVRERDALDASERVVYPIRGESL